jgi:hypothetical protein
MSGDRAHRQGNGATRDARDELLGAALRRLEVPEHRPGFHAELRERLAAAIAAADAAGPARPKKARAPKRRALRRTTAWTLRLAAAATVALTVYLVVANLPGTAPQQPPQVATAALVRGTVVHAWASAENISGELRIRSTGVFGKGTIRWRFILTSRGDFRLTDLTRGGDLAYDASRGVERSLNVSESIPGSKTLFASEHTGLAPGPPDPSSSAEILDRSLGAVVRALAAGGGGTVKQTTWQGRPAWLLDTAVRVNAIAPQLSPDHLQVTVDRQSGFPVRVVASHQGRLVWESQIVGLRVNLPLPAAAFRLRFPAGMEVSRTDAGFRRVALADVPKLVGYQPLVPSWVPEGYRLAEVAASRKGSPTGAEGTNPVTDGVVSLSYRRGLDQFLVTTRLVGADRSAWGDPLATGEGLKDRPERIRITRGALAGQEVRLLIDPLAVPHLWGITSKLVVTVSGDLTSAEFLRVTNSLG